MSSDDRFYGDRSETKKFVSGLDRADTSFAGFNYLVPPAFVE